MSTLRLIYDVISKKLADFKDIHKYTRRYQATFDKVVGLLTDSSHYTHKNIDIYFQTMMLMNIRTKYSAFILAIQKDWKDKTTNLMETMLQIIRHFKFLEENKKSNKVVLQILTSKPSARSRPFLIAPKRSCKNQECINKHLISTHYTNRC